MSLARAVLGPDFDRLPPVVAAFRGGPGVWRGHVDVERGRGPLVAAALRLGGFPPAGRDLPLVVAS